VYYSALVSAFEKAKKKYVVKMKKMETQMQLMTERHESQVVFISVIFCFKHSVFV